MKHFFSFVAGFFYQEPAKPSMTRLCGLLCTITLCIGMLSSVFTGHELSPSNPLIQTVGLLAFGCLGLIAAVKIFKDKTSPEKPPVE